MKENRSRGRKGVPRKKILVFLRSGFAFEGKVVYILRGRLDMKKKIKCKHIFCEMFQTNYYVYYGISPSEYKNEVKKVSGCDIDLSYGANDTIDGEACVYNVEGVEVIFIWTKHKYISVLVHECMHAVHMILRDKNITLSDETDELYAYYMQNLVRRILEGDKK